MTPDAVIHRYLELIAQPSVPVPELCELIAADADLLARWLRLLDCPADINALRSRIEGLDADEFDALSQALAWSVLPIVGSARLSVDQWLTVLKAACLAELLYATVESGADNPNIRTRSLLALSGVNLDSDPELHELIEYRGINPVLLEDADLELKVFAVADGVETGRERELAKQLLGLDGSAFEEVTEQADEVVSGLSREIGIDLDDGSDWAQRIWLRQHVTIACASFRSATSLAQLIDLHRTVSRTLFSTVPEILARKNAHLTAQVHSDVTLSATSVTSRIAQALRVKQPVPIVDSPDLAVVDRQILHALHAEEGLVVPIVNDEPHGVLIVQNDEDIEIEFAAELYAEELGKWLGKAPAPEPDDAVSSEVASFRAAEVQRLREIVHEANNPLSIVHNYLHILELRLRSDPELAEQIDMISQELRRAGEVFATARDVPEHTARAAVATSDEQTEFDVATLTRRAGEIQRGYANEHGVNIDIDDTFQPVLLRSVEGKLAQVLSNLIKNAIEACKAGDTVTVRCRTGIYRDGRAGSEIIVEDTGPGIEASVLAVLSQPKDTDKGGDHQGLGLHLTYRLISELGGFLDVRTEPEEGTAFHIFLPASD